MIELETEAMEIVLDMVRVAASPDADLSVDGVDERLFAARIEAIALFHLQSGGEGDSGV